MATLRIEIDRTDGTSIPRECRDQLDAVIDACEQAGIDVTLTSKYRTSQPFAQFREDKRLSVTGSKTAELRAPTDGILTMNN